MFDYIEGRVKKAGVRDLIRFETAVKNVSYDAGKESGKFTVTVKDLPGDRVYSENFDHVICCTGYQHHFPFMEDDLRLHTPNVLASNDLYKGVAYVPNPDLFHVGMQDQWFTFNMFDAQAWWAPEVIMGRIELPDASTMQADVAKRQADEAGLADDYACIWYQGDYTLELIKATDYPTFDVEGACQAFKEWKGHKKANIMTFRNNSYKSVITGTMAPKHHTPWKDAMDDSLEVYLQN